MQQTLKEPQVLKENTDLANPPSKEEQEKLEQLK
jgi:hypothetical protein